MADCRQRRASPAAPLEISATAWDRSIAAAALIKPSRWSGICCHPRRSGVSIKQWAISTTSSHPPRTPMRKLAWRSMSPSLRPSPTAATSVRSPKAQALAAEVADTVTFVQLPGESRVEIARLARDFRAKRDLELALHVSVIGDTVAPFMASPDTDPAALRAADSLATLPDHPAAAAEELQRRREEIGFSYVVVGGPLRRRAGSGRSGAGGTLGPQRRQSNR